ncbi:unknown protein [Desulfotalea psychrophila LSv54]|uniref:DUF1318 domain-containing protein n=2 Tax=Desulfotalea psychrophila TaxID=84980 RepID=Q6AIL2_DESPS|nr:unknown protein [Desulfotalea psychrophila LSv54]
MIISLAISIRSKKSKLKIIRRFFMQSLRQNFSYLFLLCCLVLASSPSQAASAQDIQNRMRTRIPAITDLKDLGIVGESNRGLLEYRSQKRTHAAIVTAENKDRQLVYRAIGKQQGVSPNLVGKRRAITIAERGTKGHIFQNANGSWYRK